MLLMALPLDVALLTARFLGAIDVVEEAFLRRLLGFLGRDLECWHSDLNESTSLWRSFPLRVIRWLIRNISENREVGCRCKMVIIRQTIDNDRVFLRGKPNRENYKKEEK